MKRKKLKIDNIDFSYPKSNFLFRKLTLDLSLGNNSGKVYSILGSSGIGKTTLLKLISKNLVPSRGEIKTIPKNPRISYLPQEPVLFDHLSVEENIKYFERVKSHKEYFDPLYTDKLISLLDLTKIATNKKSIDEISGGQKQRIALARALSIKPDFLFLDEPTTGLNGLTKQDFTRILRSLIQKQPILTLYVTHQLDEAKYISDEVLYLTKAANGNTDVVQCKTLDFFSKPPLLEAALEIGFPSSNKLKCKIEGNLICLTDDSQEDNFYLYIKNDNIEFSDLNGWKFQIEVINDIFTNLKLSDNQSLTINQTSSKQEYVRLTGDIMRYSVNGKYVDTLKVDANKIILRSNE
jgi:NitT/TauT family transport system ATP-binding protein